MAASTYVQKTNAVDGSLPSLIGVAHGNLIVIGFTGYPSMVVSSVSDSNGNTYVQATTAAAGFGSYNTDIWYCLNANAGNTGTITPTWGTTPTYYAMHVFEFHNAGGSLTFDAGSHASGASQNSTAGSIVTTAGTDLLFTMLNNSANPVTPPGGWDTSNQQFTAAAFYDHSLFNLDAGSAGTKSAVITQSASDYAQSVAAFKIPGGGGGGGSAGKFGTNSLRPLNPLRGN